MKPFVDGAVTLVLALACFPWMANGATCSTSCENTNGMDAMGDSGCLGGSRLGKKCDSGKGRCVAHSDASFKCKDTNKFLCECKAKTATMTGDPHLWTWQGVKFEYQGVCDLMLVRNTKFENGKGFELHARTSPMLEGRFSYMSEAALRIGTDTLELRSHDRTILLNGKQVSLENMERVKLQDLPFTVGGHSVTLEAGDMTEVIAQKPRVFNTMKLKVLINRGTPEEATIAFRIVRQVLTVDLSGDNEKEVLAQGSIGMMGTYPFPGDTHGRVARDGITLMDDPNAFAEEWQVKPNMGDAILFSEPRFPQFPDACVPPTTSSSESDHRSLRFEAEEIAALKKLAMESCDFLFYSDHNAYEACMYDVIAMGDESAAFAYVG